MQERWNQRNVSRSWPYVVLSLSAAVLLTVDVGPLEAMAWQTASFP